MTNSSFLVDFPCKKNLHKPENGEFGYCHDLPEGMKVRVLSYGKATIFHPFVPHFQDELYLLWEHGNRKPLNRNHGKTMDKNISVHGLGKKRRNICDVYIKEQIMGTLKSGEDVPLNQSSPSNPLGQLLQLLQVLMKPRLNLTYQDQAGSGGRILKYPEVSHSTIWVCCGKKWG